MRKRGHATHRRPPVGAHVGVRRRLAGREDEDIPLPCLLRVRVDLAADEKPEVLRGAACRVEILGDQDDASPFADDRRDDRRARTTANASDVDPPAWPECANPLGDIPEASRDDPLRRKQRRQGLERLVGRRWGREIVRGEARMLLEGRAHDIHPRRKSSAFTAWVSSR